MDHLTVDPATAAVTAGTSQDDTAEGFDQFDNALAAETGPATFSLTGGSCAGNTRTAGQAGAQTGIATGGHGERDSEADGGTGAHDHLVVSPDRTAMTAGTAQAFTAMGFDAFRTPYGTSRLESSAADIVGGAVWRGLALREGEPVRGHGRIIG